jgi:hypothetical protein
MIQMKNYLTILLALVTLFLVTSLNAQNKSHDEPLIPYKLSRSPVFGKDIVIDDQPTQNQQSVVVCSAYNGWLFSAYTYNNNDNQAAVRIMKSTDSGINWSQFFDGSIGLPLIIIPKIEILVCGNNETDLKLFLSILLYDSIYNSGGAVVDRINGLTGMVENILLENDGGGIRDISIASDNFYQAVNSNPFSIAIIYSKEGYSDSLIIRTSSNGGVSLDSKTIVALEPPSSPNIFRNVSLSYGFCQSKNTGRYFAAWEKQNENSTSNLGHIYTAHSEPNFYSAFTAPICLDSLDTAFANRCSSPVISCQVSNTDNDSLNLTQVVLFQKSNPGTNTFDIQGCYNLQATNSSYFKTMTLDPSTDIKTQPDICYNPFESKFMVTYFNSTSQKLPFITNDVNFVNPDTWEFVSTGYNDQPDIVSPNPKVEINYLLHSGIDVWLENGNAGKSTAMFDAQYSTYTGFVDSQLNKNELVVKVYPNPCKSFVNINFELPSEEMVIIALYNQLGDQVTSEKAQKFSSGTNKVIFNVSNFSTGCYFYKIETKSTLKFGKISVVR